MFAAHVPLALAMWRLPALATGHGLAVLGVGLVAALGARRKETIAYIGAYIVGSEVMWRMAGSRLFWEFGKYALAAVFMVGVARFRLRAPLLALLFFVLLIPSCILTVSDQDPETVKKWLSFYMSGPLSLVASAWFLSHASLGRRELRTLLTAALAPLVGTAAIAVVGTVTAADIEWVNDSNFATSGGFGPNQVSSALSLGALVCLLLALDRHVGKCGQVCALAGTLLLAGVSAMTFSRGGLYTAGAAAIAASIVLIRHQQSRGRVAVVATVLAAAAVFVVGPRLDAYTGGALSRRFRDTNPSGRDRIARVDLHIWAEHPVLGVGPGRSPHLRAAAGAPGAAHTEFSRVLAEHGVLGLYALVLLVGSAVRNVARARHLHGRAVATSFAAWSFAFMFHAAMRLAAPGFTLGLTFARFTDGDAT